MQAPAVVAGPKAAFAALTRTNGRREKQRLCEDGGFTSPQLQSLASSLHAPAPPFPTGSVPGGSHAPFHDRSWTDSPVVLRGFPDVPSPSVERVCPRCDPNASGPDAAYPEPIITASAPLVRQLSWRAGASDHSANPLSGSGRDSQSALRVAVSDQLKPPAAPLTNRMCPACRWTLIWLRCGTQATDKNNKKTPNNF